LWAIQAIAQKWGNCQKNWIAKRTQPPTDRLSFPAAQPMRQGRLPGTAPTSTEIELTFFSGVYIKAYTNKLKAANAAARKLKCQRIRTPPVPATTAKVQASWVLMRPDATGRLAVRFMRASVSFSTIWLIVLAAPVTSMPPRKKRMIATQSYSLTFGASK